MTRNLRSLLGVLALLAGAVFCAAPAEVAPTVEVGAYADAPTHAVAATDSATPTDTPVLPTETPNPSTAPTGTPTLASSRTPTGTPTPQRTRTPTPTPLPYAAMQVAAQGDIYGGGCQWMGIAGQVFGVDGFPIFGIIVRLNGGGYKDIDRFTGDDPEYGPGGYEFFLTTQARAERYTVQLFRADGAPLSDAAAVATTANCLYNLYIVNWSGPGVGGAP